MLTSKDIAIVILNWNGKALLEVFLPSVITHSEAASIYVVDNASTDDSAAFIASHFPQVKWIQNSTNGGYAKGYNDALKHVEAPLLCLLNNDIEVSKGWLAPILDAFNSNDTIAITQPKILDHKNKTRFEYAGAAGGFIDKYGYPYCRGRIFEHIEEDTGQYNDLMEIFWASGACLFIKNPVFRALDGFDESFFAHMEEIDLCWRAFNQGHKVYYVGDSTVYHVGGATLSNSNPKKTYLNFRNSLFTIVKNTQHPFFIVIIRLILDGIAGFRFLIKLQWLHFVAILKAHFSFYRHLPKLIKARRSLQKRSGYYQITSIVWSYFIKNDTHYSG